MNESFHRCICGGRISAAQLLKLGRLDARSVANASEIIVRQAAHMTDLVNDLLDVSRITRGRFFQLPQAFVAPPLRRPALIPKLDQSPSILHKRMSREIVFHS